MTAKNNKTNWPYSKLKILIDDAALLEAINGDIDGMKGEFAYRTSPPYTSDLKNPKIALKAFIGKEIYESLYPSHISTQSARQLLRVITPLNLMAAKWRAPYFLEDNPDHYSICKDDYFGDRHHKNVMAMTKFDEFMKRNGDFMDGAKAMVYVLDMLVAETIRIKPRTEHDFDDPLITYCSGLDDAIGYVEGLFDAVLAKYPAIPHKPEQEPVDYAFYQHLCKNAGINIVINAGKFHIKENAMMREAFSGYLEWLAERDVDVPFIASSLDWDMAFTIASIHAYDKGGNGQYADQFARNMQEEYLRRVIPYIHYLRDAKNTSNKPVTLKLIRRGQNNKGIKIYPELVSISEAIFSRNEREIKQNTIAHINEHRSNAEIIKYASNVFSVLTCWEYVGENIEVQTDDYFTFRHQTWSHRNKIIEKLLPLNFVQLTHFYKEIEPILQAEIERLSAMREAILHARNCG